MKIDFATWPDGTTVTDFVETPESLELSSDMSRFDDEVKVTVTVHKTDDEAIVEGRLAARAMSTCVRCLDEFEVVVEEEFRRIGKLVPTAQISEDTGDPDYLFLPSNEPVWDLNGMIREIILLTVPENPLCDEDCRGLCRKCGQNLNVKQCGCEQPKNDSPLVQLKDLLSGKHIGDV
jgi:uncharacterized protein